MNEWQFVETEPTEHFCNIQYFGLKKHHAEGDVEFLITVREYITPPDPAMKFFAQADKQTNQATVAFTPVGWGTTLSSALRECVRAIRRFPYQPRGK